MPLILADEASIPTGWRTRKPGSLLWTLLSIPRVVFTLVFYSLVYLIFPSSRPNKKWSFRQSLSLRFLKSAFDIVTETAYGSTLSLEDEGLGKRWVVMKPGPEEAYTDELAPREESRGACPAKIGGTWYPSPPPKSNTADDKDDGLVVLYFHGGSFLWFTGRPNDSGEGADLLNSRLGKSTRSLWVQYRLVGDARNPTTFPGPMQDALTAYIYLVNELGISPERIVVGGDSAGATVAAALVRYLCMFSSSSSLSSSPRTSHPEQDSYLSRLSTPLPRACLLLSPSLDYTFEGNPDLVSRSPNTRTDYLSAPLLAWGVAVFMPPPLLRLDNPFISPALHPFDAKGVRFFVQAGGGEVLCESARRFVEEMRKVNGVKRKAEGKGKGKTMVNDELVEYLEVEGAPHDVFALPGFMGWAREREKVVDAAVACVLRD